MLKKVLLLLSSVTVLFAATPEQVERYLLLSGSEDQLIEFEQMVDGMGKMFAARGGSDAPLMQDSQMLPIRFREYIQRNLSEDEMDAVIANYGHDVLRKLIQAQVLMEEPETLQSYRQFLQRIQDDPLPTNRTETVKGIIKKLYDEKTLTDFFDQMFLPMVEKMGRAGGQKMTGEQIDALGKRFVKQMRVSNYNAMLFMTRDFTDSELEALDEISGNSASSHETRAVFGAIVYAMGEAMHNMTRRMATMVKNHQHPVVIPQGNDANRSNAGK